MTQQDNPNASGTATANPAQATEAGPSLTPQEHRALMNARRDATGTANSDVFLVCQLRFGARWSRQQIQDFLGVQAISVERVEQAWRARGLDSLRDMAVNYDGGTG